MAKTASTNLSKPDAVKFQDSLLGWYDRNKRDLPWRRSKDPYAIFVSEMMLQQTQVKTVIPYYERFLEELPDWEALAKAKEEKVLKLWEGLGYYRRARNLQAAAQKITGDLAGKLPGTLGEILEIPGVGPYSAGAILSIAFQKPHPVVDGNVIRVFSRLFLLGGNLKTGEGHKKVWELAENLISRKRPGDFNQAVMELGATVCLPDNPRCLLCPLLSHCQASQKGLQNELPEIPKAAPTVEVPMAALYVEQKGKVLVKKRSKSEKWLKGLWEFPSAQGTTFGEALQKLEEELRVKAGRRAVQEVKHQITHHKVRLKLFRAVPSKSIPLSQELKWVSLSELVKLPFASAQDKLRSWALKLHG
ncbi:MAG TPA: A/G-specific adenine glycosylase [Puia sp.]|nr:A/G-specific adenine glycosylase [Puia sp.]